MNYQLILCLLFLQGTPNAALHSEQTRCCRSFADVLVRARSIISSRTEQLIVVEFLPPDLLGRPGASHETIGRCIEAFKMEIKSNHAFLISTPAGAAVYYWDKAIGQSQEKILRGADPLTSLGNGLRLVNVTRNGSSGIPGRSVATYNLLVLAPKEFLLESAAISTLQLLKQLKLSTAAVYFRSDPWFWPTGCVPPSLPVMWSFPIPDPLSIEKQTIKCEVAGFDPKPHCAIVDL